MNLNELVEQVARHEISSSEAQKLLHNNILDSNKSGLLIDKDKVHDLVKKFLKRSLKDADREKHYSIVKSEFSSYIILILTGFVEPEIGSSISMLSSISTILMDSLAVMNFNTALKTQYSIDISPTILFEHDTLEGFIDFLLKKYYFNIVTACLFPNFNQDRFSKQLSQQEHNTTQASKVALKNDNSFIDHLEQIWSSVKDNNVESIQTLSGSNDEDAICINSNLSAAPQSHCPLSVPRHIDFSGYENIPDQGGFIIAMNHTFWFDKYKSLGFLSELIQHKCHRKPYFLMADILRITHVFNRKYFQPLYLKRQNNLGDYSTLDNAIALLKMGEIVCLYPEGRQNRGELVQARTGVAHMALAARVDILPIAVTGVINKSSRFKRRRQLIKVSQAISLSELQDQNNALQPLTDRIMRSIALLLPEDQRGFYA